MGHFDGWQPFGSSYRGSGSFAVSVANMKKAERNHVEEVYVVSFVPCSQVPNLPNGLEPFWQPVMNDLCEGFIEGYKVNYPKGIIIPGCEPSNEEIVRLLLLAWTADHPGQCETGKFFNQGKCACRRCKLVGRHLQNSSNTHYYYGQIACILDTLGERGSLNQNLEIFLILRMKQDQVFGKECHQKKALPDCPFFTSIFTTFMDLTF